MKKKDMLGLINGLIILLAAYIWSLTGHEITPLTIFAIWIYDLIFIAIAGLSGLFEYNSDLDI